MHDTTLFPETEEVYLSQTHLSDHRRLPTRGGEVTNTMIPETLPNSQGGVGENVEIKEGEIEDVLPDSIVVEEGERASSPSSDAVPETRMATDESEEGGGYTVVEETEVAAQTSSPTKKGNTVVG